jgi:hypothetical protein
MATAADNTNFELALEKAAKIICSMKCGLCPIREDNFTGCPYACTEDIRPWRCWVDHLLKIAGSV